MFSNHRKLINLLCLFFISVFVSACDGVFINVSPDLGTTIATAESEELTFRAKVRPGVPNSFYGWSATVYSADGEELDRISQVGEEERFTFTTPETEFAFIEVSCESYYYFISYPQPFAISPPPPSKNGEITWLVKPDLISDAGVLPGSAIIGNPNDLVDLQGVTTVEGSLVISDVKFDVSEIVSEIVSEMTSIDGGLIVKNNSTLGSMSELGIDLGITQMSSLVINNNASLSDLAGLENLESVSGSVEIKGNDALTSVTELESLATVGGDLRVLYNDSLCDSNADALLDQVESQGGVGGSAVALNEDC